MSNPTLVLVHGSWHVPAHFSALIKELQNHGYKCVAIELPSVRSPELPPATYEDDTKAVRDTVARELDQGNNVVVVAHSAGGYVVNGSLKGFDSQSRVSSGATTAVLALAFIAAIPLPPGLSMLELLDGNPGPVLELRNENFICVSSPGPTHWFYNDLPEEEAKKWSGFVRPQSWVSYRGKTTDAAYMDIPSGYLHCTNDNALSYEVQKKLVGDAIEAGAQFVHIDTVDSSHSPFLSMPQRTAEFVRKVAGENIE